jgi:hypothetical protein
VLYFFCLSVTACLATLYFEQRDKRLARHGFAFPRYDVKDPATVTVDRNDTDERDQRRESITSIDK